MNTLKLIAAFFLLAAPLASPAADAVRPPASSSAGARACPASLRYTMDRLQDEKPQSLCQYAGKVLLVVNTASFCGFTPQYRGLEDLYARYRDRGLVVLGFPSNDFAQETGSNKEIADFCESTFGVKFPMFTKTTVTGDQAHPFYKMLAEKTGRRPLWNFHKYLIGRNGDVIATYTSLTGPDSKELLRDIEKQLLEK